MRLSHLIMLVVTVVAACGGASLALAHNGEVHTAAAQAVASLPLPGLTPGSPLYFLDQWMEKLQRFFTFGREAKARLEIRLAGERVAEIKVLSETKDLDDPVLHVAEQLLMDHVEAARDLVMQEKAEGEDVAALESDLNADLRFHAEELTQVFSASAEEEREIMESVEALGDFETDLRQVEALSAGLENTNGIEFMDVPLSGEAGKEMRVYWEIRAASGANVSSSGVYFDNQSHSGAFGGDTSPVLAGYPHFAQGDFIARITPAQAGNLYLRAYAVINGKHYWTAQKVVRIK